MQIRRCLVSLPGSIRCPARSAKSVRFRMDARKHFALWCHCLTPAQRVFDGHQQPKLAPEPGLDSAIRVSTAKSSRNFPTVPDPGQASSPSLKKESGMPRFALSSEHPSSDSDSACSPVSETASAIGPTRKCASHWGPAPDEHSNCSKRRAPALPVRRPAPDLGFDGEL